MWFLGMMVVIFSVTATAFAAGEEECTDICLHPELTVPYDQCIALTHLRVANAGPSWTNTGNWITSPDVELWRGVTLGVISGTRQVTALELPDNNLQ